MKKIFSSLLAVALLTAAGTSMAWWSDNDDWGGGPWGGDWNPYDEWDPRYWMEEMEQEWDDDDDYYRRGYGGYGGPYGGGYGGYPYGGGYGGYPYGGGGYAPYGGGYGGYPYGGGGYAPAPAPAPAAPATEAAPAAPAADPYGGGYAPYGGGYYRGYGY